MTAFPSHPYLETIVSTEVSPQTIHDLKVQISALIEEVRQIENVVVALHEIASRSQSFIGPEVFRKFKHKDTGTLLCTTELNPGEKWERVCKKLTWSSQGECDRDTCKL